MNTEIRTSVPFQCPIAQLRTGSEDVQKVQLIRRVTSADLYRLGKHILSCSALLSSQFLAQVIHILTLRPTAAAWEAEVEDSIYLFIYLLEWKFSCLLHRIKRLERASASQQFTLSSPFPPRKLSHGCGTSDKYLSSLCLEASSCGIPTASPGNPHPCH